MRKAFVSGGTRGIGKAIANRLLTLGYEVGICYRSSVEAADEMKRAFPDQLCLFPCDLSLLGSAEELAKNVLNRMEGVDLLVNNAAVSHYGLIQDVSESDFDRIVSVNLKSAFFLTRGLIGPMIQKGEGSIVTLSSVWGQTGASCEVLYSATKSAVIGFTKALAKELAPSGVRVNCIAPGVVDTDMMSRFSAEEKQLLMDEIPMGRFTLSDEIADTVVFLDRYAPKTLTGQVIAINGGMYC